MSHIVIYGRGKTGQYLEKLLHQQGKEAVFYDDESGFDDNGKFNADTTVIVSPGITPKAKGVRLAKKVGAKVIGELSYSFSFCKGRCVSITGTNGKTTVCQMINHILQGIGKTVYLLGNGGVPLCSKVLEVQPNDVVVLESSSFQLKDATNFQPYISVLTNLAPDHLDYHGSFENYCLAKQNNFLHQEESSFAIFNADDKSVVRLSSKCRCRALFYSVDNPFSNCYFDGERVVLQLQGKVTKILAPFCKKLPKHNLSNCLCAILTVALLGVEVVDSLTALNTFAFLPHRVQRVATVNGVTFVDDSKGTNVHATVCAMHCFEENLALILGGYDKGYPFDDIFTNAQANVKYLCASGQTARKIANCGKKYGYEVDVFYDISQCVYACYDRLKGIGGVVLMSNACSSFDCFDSYVQRGEYFQRVVKELQIDKKV